MDLFVVKYAWLIPALPLLAAILIAITGAKILKGQSHLPAILAMLGSTCMALGLLWAFQTGQIVDVAGNTLNSFSVPLYDWFGVGTFKVPLALYFDHLTAIYLSFVTGIGLLIFIYASGYMKGDFGYFRFFAFMSIFVFFMTVLVTAGNFVLLYLGWEGVGLASYLLIGYYYPRPSAVAAAKKAFITNRIGDFGFAIGIFLVFLTFGSINYADVLFNRGAIRAAMASHEWWLYLIPFLLMVGAFGKSAQFPLHVWLPDAMEGPTPVSALIHAATMVTAGVYMIARCMPLFMAIPGNHDALRVVACIGCFTALLAASIALCQYDLKRIWAYSTLSQLGYMFLGLGVAASSAAVFHVFTHAFFKALLFLTAGSVMHAMGGELDIRKMSGIGKYMPKTKYLTLIGCLALAGFPGFAGFFSKDEIIASAINSPGATGWMLGITAFVVALMTAYYTFRVWFRVFVGPVQLPATAGHHEPSPFALADDHGADHGGHEEAHAHDSDHGAAAHTPNDGPLSMWAPLVILAIGAIGAGYLGVFGHVEGGVEGGWFHGFLSSSQSFAVRRFGGGMAREGESAVHVSEGILLTLGIIIPLLGIGIAAFFHWYNRHAASIAAANMRPLQRFLENKWYIDEIYRELIIRPLWVFAHVLSIIDRFVVDGVVFLIGFFPQLIGYTLKPTQRGMMQRYAVGMVAGVAAVIIGLLWFLRS